MKNKCLKITITGVMSDTVLRKIQKNAKLYNIEGIAQRIHSDLYRLVVYGDKDNIDSMIDDIHKVSAKENIQDIEIEAYIKDRDYRGVFRIISGG